MNYGPGRAEKFKGFNISNYNTVLYCCICKYEYIRCMYLQYMYIIEFDVHLFLFNINVYINMSTVLLYIICYSIIY